MSYPAGGPFSLPPPRSLQNLLVDAHQRLLQVSEESSGIPQSHRRHTHIPLVHGLINGYHRRVDCWQNAGSVPPAANQSVPIL